MRSILQRKIDKLNAFFVVSCKDVTFIVPKDHFIFSDLRYFHEPITLLHIKNDSPSVSLEKTSHIITKSGM